MHCVHPEVYVITSVICDEVSAFPTIMIKRWRDGWIPGGARHRYQYDAAWFVPDHPRGIVPEETAAQERRSNADCTLY